MAAPAPSSESAAGGMFRTELPDGGTSRIVRTSVCLSNMTQCEAAEGQSVVGGCGRGGGVVRMALASRLDLPWAVCVALMLGLL